jgi:hypothetical protein
MDNSHRVADLSEHSVLAENFVPEHLRRVNEWYVTAPLPAATQQQTVTAGPKKLLVPFVPICYCGGNASVSAVQHLHAYPLRTVPSDLYYAVEYRAGKLQPSKNEESLPAVPPPKKVPSVDNISSLDDYLSTWEKNLEAERKEVLLRYENYSQYAKPVQIRTIALQTKGHPTTFAGVLLKATLDVNGIADASPPLMIGDTVLLRPMHRVSLPMPKQHAQARLDDLQWSPAIHVAEVQARVLSVQRGTSSIGDKVIFSWLDRESSDILLHTLRSAAQSVHSKTTRKEPYLFFNVRFVPAATRHERCLTALDWLHETYKDNPQSAMDLLFPVTAPAVFLPASELASNDILAHSNQLNDKQASFVNMVLGRTQHPSTDQIRGPMVLTGPAGTGSFDAMACFIPRTTFTSHRYFVLRENEDNAVCGSCCLGCRSR